MPRYFFNIRDGVSIPDVDGTELAGIEEAKREAVRLSGRLLSEDPEQFWNGENWFLDVLDETGFVFLRLMFAAVEEMAPADVTEPVTHDPSLSVDQPAHSTLRTE